MISNRYIEKQTLIIKEHNVCYIIIWSMVGADLWDESNVVLVKHASRSNIWLVGSFFRRYKKIIHSCKIMKKIINQNYNFIKLFKIK